MPEAEATAAAPEPYKVNLDFVLRNIKGEPYLEVPGDASLSAAEMAYIEVLARKGFAITPPEKMQTTLRHVLFKVLDVALPNDFDNKSRIAMYSIAQKMLAASSEVAFTVPETEAILKRLPYALPGNWVVGVITAQLDPAQFQKA